MRESRTLMRGESRSRRKLMMLLMILWQRVVLQTSYSLLTSPITILTENLLLKASQC